MLEGWEAGYLLGGCAGEETKRVSWAFTLGIAAAVVHVAAPRLVLAGLVSLVLLIPQGVCIPVPCRCRLPGVPVSPRTPSAGAAPRQRHPPLLLLLLQGEECGQSSFFGS